jgi:hypothetical protein
MVARVIPTLARVERVSARVARVRRVEPVARARVHRVDPSAAAKRRRRAVARERRERAPVVADRHLAELDERALDAGDEERVLEHDEVRARSVHDRRAHRDADPASPAERDHVRRAEHVPCAFGGAQDDARHARLTEARAGARGKLHDALGEHPARRARFGARRAVNRRVAARGSVGSGRHRPARHREERRRYSGSLNVCAYRHGALVHGANAIEYVPVVPASPRDGSTKRPSSAPFGAMK